MEISELCEEVYDSLNGEIVGVVWRDSLTILFECDDWRGSDHRRSFEISCIETIRQDISIGDAVEIWLRSDDPLLWEYNCPSAHLYFSSRPVNSYELIGRLTVEHDQIFRGWLPVSHYTNGLADGLETILSGAYGLIASGPLPLMEAYQISIADLMQTNIVVGRAKHHTYQILFLGSAYAICKSVKVEEVETSSEPRPTA